MKLTILINDSDGTTRTCPWDLLLDSELFNTIRVARNLVESEDGSIKWRIYQVEYPVWNVLKVWDWIKTLVMGKNLLMSVSRIWRGEIYIWKDG